MTYSSFDLAIDLETALRQPYDPLIVGKLASGIYFEHLGNMTDNVFDAVITLMTMEEGPEFALKEEEIRRLILDLKNQETDAGKRTLYNCRVCGFTLGYLPWGRNGTTPTWELCPCCGVQFGVMDETPFLARQERQQWRSNGSPWFDEKQKPNNWDIDAQLEHIPDEFK